MDLGDGRFKFTLALVGGIFSNLERNWCQYLSLFTKESIRDFKQRTRAFI